MYKLFHKTLYKYFSNRAFHRLMLILPHLRIAHFPNSFFHIWSVNWNLLVNR